MAQLWGYVEYADRPAGKEQQEWFPLKCTYDSTNKKAVLKVDTEISVDGATLNIDNLFVASTDNTPANAKYIKIAADGTVQIAGTVDINVGTPKHYNGVANVLSATVNFAATTKSILVQNIDAAKIVYISFDGGSNWKSIKPLDNVSLQCAISSLDIKASVDGANYEILTTE